jgi:hypothetical protein
VASEPPTDAQGNDSACVLSVVQCHFQKNFSCFCACWRAPLTTMYWSIGCGNVTVNSRALPIVGSIRFARARNRRRLESRRTLVERVPERRS